MPSSEEIEALLAGRKQTTIVFFLDETFEELEFDSSTTVLEAVEFLAHVIKLQNFTTFTLYECRKARRLRAHLHTHLHAWFVKVAGDFLGRVVHKASSCLRCGSAARHASCSAHACDKRACWQADDDQFPVWACSHTLRKQKSGGVCSRRSIRCWAKCALEFA